MGDRLQGIFFEVFESLPRQGPGDAASTTRALALCRGLPAEPAVLDLGCGTGAQTLELALLLGGTITAVDLHAPSIERLRAAVVKRGLANRVRPLVADMTKLDVPPASVDLVWSEGALYNLGLAKALPLCRDLLRPGGYLAFTDAVYRTDDPPAEVRAMFADYATMGRAADLVAEVARAGLALVDHFTLPDESWWDDFYTPLLARIEELRGKYAGDADAQAALDQLAAEPAMHEHHARHYAYEMVVARR